MAKQSPLTNLKTQVQSSMESLPDRVSVVPVAATSAPASVPEPEPAASRPTGSKSSREGKRFLGYYVEPTRHDEIRQAAMYEGIQVQELMRRAIDAWMDEHGQEAVQIVATRNAKRGKKAN